MIPKKGALNPSCYFGGSRRPTKTHPSPFANVPATNRDVYFCCVSMCLLRNVPSQALSCVASSPVISRNKCEEYVLTKAFAFKVGEKHASTSWQQLKKPNHPCYNHVIYLYIEKI